MVERRGEPHAEGGVQLVGRGRVVIAGSLNVDVVLRVEHLPTTGQTVHARAQRRGPGGKGLNQAVAASGDGASVSIIGCVGDDAAGRTLLSTLTDHGVDVDAVRVTTGVETGLATVCVDDQGDNAIVIAAGANGHVTRADVEGVAFGPDDVLVAQGEIPLEISTHFLARGRSAGATTILNLAPFAAPSPTLLAATSILVVNDAELIDLAAWCAPGVDGLDGPSVVQAVGGILSAGPRAVVLTLGAAGAVLIAADGIVAVPGHRVDVTDTTGAGDAFTGVLAAELVHGTDLATAVVRANDAASLVVQRPGAAEAMPSRSEIVAVRAPA